MSRRTSASRSWSRPRAHQLAAPVHPLARGFETDDHGPVASTVPRRPAPKLSPALRSRPLAQRLRSSRRRRFAVATAPDRSRPPSCYRIDDTSRSHSATGPGCLPVRRRPARPHRGTRRTTIRVLDQASGEPSWRGGDTAHRPTSRPGHHLTGRASIVASTSRRDDATVAGHGTSSPAPPSGRRDRSTRRRRGCPSPRRRGRG